MNKYGCYRIRVLQPDESGTSGKTQSDVVARQRPRRGLLDSDDATVSRPKHLNLLYTKACRFRLMTSIVSKA